jgi:hypothetical protein
MPSPQCILQLFHRLRNGFQALLVKSRYISFLYYQIALWDGCASGASGTCDWAGGEIQWGGESSFRASFGSLNIQCYDDKDQPVAKWPINQDVPTSSVPGKTFYFNY